MGSKRSAGKLPFQFTFFTAVQFVVLTVVAMFFYPGGTGSDPDSAGYSFLRNFFSSLGLTVAQNGEPNWISAGLFFIALTLAGLGLVVYYIFCPKFFWHKPVLKVLSVLGSICGVFSGICFIGVAFTPANLLPGQHGWFVINAFRTFLFVAIFYTAAVFLNQRYPSQYGWLYLLFSILLAVYVWLLISGPRASTPQGEIIQATGQKIIVYAAIITMLIQSYGSIKLLDDAPIDQLQDQP